MKRPGDLQVIPEGPGVYVFTHGETVLYVGKAKNLKRRLSQYFTAGASDRTKAMTEKATDLRWMICASEAEALVLEQQWISTHQPAYNVLLKYGDGYCGVAVSTESTPRLFTWRGARPTKAKSFGPYPGVRSRELISALSFAFGVRSCSRGTFAKASKSQVPCILADTGHCLAPCLERTDRARYNKAVERLKSFLQGRTTAVIEELTRDMNESSARLDYEKAALARDRLAALERTLGKQVLNEAGKWSGVVVEAFTGQRTGIAMLTLDEGRVVALETASVITREKLTTRDAIEEFVSSKGYEEGTMPVSATETGLTRMPRGSREKAVSSFVSRQAKNAAIHGNGTATIENYTSHQEELVDNLELPKPPRRIEALDVSHTGGRHPVAAFAVLVDGSLARDQVRYVTVPPGGDDIAGIAHATSKRFNGGKLGMSAYPDVLLVDGGVLQAQAAAQLLPPGCETFVVGIAKRVEELWIPGRTDPVVLPRGGALTLLMAARDHAHSLALRKHTSARDAALVKTRMAGLAHIGPKRKTKLLAAFGSFDAVVAATREEFKDVLGPTIGAKAWDSLQRVNPGPDTPRRPEASNN